MLSRFYSRISRRKQYDVNAKEDIVQETILPGTGPKLLRVLSLFDLTFLGIGSTLGVGIYVLAGSVGKDVAGPAVCLSFIVAAIASGISALCYAEFGARIPKAGSGYIYCYVTVGELVAFLIGWNLILEYLIGTASVARVLSSNVDVVSNHSMSRFFTKVTPIPIPHMSPYADWFSLGIGIVMTAVLALGVKSSSLFTNIFTILNLVVVGFIIIAGAGSADLKNWNTHFSANMTGTEPTTATGRGGFMPFGFSGVMAGAAKCFFGFVGFDSIAAAGEEAKNPKRAVPWSIMLTLVVVLLAYVGVSVVLTLMVPYYLQDKEIPAVKAFQYVGQSWAASIVTFGSIFGLTASLLGSMIPMPRIVYAMAKDGLLFRFLAHIHPRFKSPFSATILTGFLASVFAMVTELDTLVDMMSIGTLLAYTLVAISILIIRYDYTPYSSGLLTKGLMQNEPTQLSSKKSKRAITAYCISTVIFCFLLTCLENEDNPSSGLVVITVLAAVPPMFSMFFLVSLPKASARVYFMVPLVPLTPSVSILINVYLMLKLSSLTWLRFSVWIFVGLLVYFIYGLRHSSLEPSKSTSISKEDLSPLVENEESTLD